MEETKRQISSIRSPRCRSSHKVRKIEARYRDRDADYMRREYRFHTDRHIQITLISFSTARNSGSPV